MADNMNDKELDQGKRPVFELKMTNDLQFVFGVDEVYAYEDSTILAGQIFRGVIRPGAIVSYGSIGKKHTPVESFACYVSNIQAPNEKDKTMQAVEFASKDGPMRGRYALVIAGRAAKDFQPGGVIFMTKPQQ